MEHSSNETDNRLPINGMSDLTDKGQYREVHQRSGLSALSDRVYVTRPAEGGYA